MYSIDEVVGIYADAMVINDRDELLFASLWGRDTAIHELLGRLSVRVQEGGIDCITMMDGATTPMRGWIGDTNRLDKLTGRMPKENLFGSLTQLWLFDRLLVEPDHANRRAMILTRPNIDDPINIEARLWEVVKDLCHLPLLSHWRHEIMACCVDQGWVSCYTQGDNSFECWNVSLGETAAVEAMISRLVVDKRLLLSAA